MSKDWDHFTHLYSQSGDFLGVFIAASTWDQVRKVLEPVMCNNKGQNAEKPEPLCDWNALKEYWDFKYPVNTEVSCQTCSCCTEDWEADAPRKFKLKAANIGGLVRFECMHCHSIIIKRHFKDRIQVQCVASDSE